MNGSFQAVSDPGRRSTASGADFLRLADAIVALSAARDRDEIIEIVRRSARGLSGAEGVAVILKDEDRCHYLVEDSRSPLWAGRKFPASSCISGWAMAHNQTVVIPDVFEDPRIPHEAYRPTFVRSLIMTPVGDEEPFAAIGAYWSEARAPDPEEVAVMEALARSTATAFRNVQLYESLRREAARAEALRQEAEQRLAEREKAERHLRLLVNELNHRVKNSLATVQSVASQTFRAAGSVAEARDAFAGRLQALSLIHEMLTDANWQGARLGEIVRRILAAHVGPESGRVTAAGPEVELSPKAASALAMGLNELATNALKHGALVRADGRVTVDWALGAGAEPDLRLEWRERGGPPVVPPERTGFGARLLTRGLPLDLGGQVRLDYPPEGIVCVIRAPLSALRPRPGDPAFAP